MKLTILILAAYLLGSMPFGAWIARLRGIDILKVGSGNIGATNVYRTLGPAFGVLVLVLDVLKGLLPALLGSYLWQGNPDLQIYSFGLGLAAVFGHCFSPFLGFRGGKGIATGLGALCGASPAVAGLALLVFAVVVAITRYVSLASIIAAISVVGFGILFQESRILVGIYGGLAVFIVYKHRGNITRLISGSERRFSFKKSSESETVNKKLLETDHGDLSDEDKGTGE